MPMFRKGSMVELTKSIHTDTLIGDCGVVEDVFADGYGVCFHRKFTSATNSAERNEEYRTIFVPHDACKQPEAKLQDEKLVATLQLLQQNITDRKNARPERLLARK